jgi:hypothetical protein
LLEYLPLPVAWWMLSQAFSGHSFDGWCGVSKSFSTLDETCALLIAVYACSTFVALHVDEIRKC